MFLWGFWKQRSVSVSASVRKTLSEPTFRPKTSPKHFEIKLSQHYFSIISEMETMTSFMWTISAVLQVLPRVICYWNHRVCFQWSAPCRYKPYLLLERETVIFWTTVRIGQISEHRETGVSTRPPSCCDITQVESPGATHRIYHFLFIAKWSPWSYCSLHFWRHRQKGVIRSRQDWPHGSVSRRLYLWNCWSQTVWVWLCK